ncbi:hypothetical protein B1R32_11518 [Abditibacterium utsteinense]|uniref:Uncharacterized protein n=1 Tax=Abditibacterium utsteinense TaxID=1960156 RepID=A0A2S8SQM7_9BACT|nr:hypothetical protein [Abditibacterium utsteinense]PQV63112.1 hypothetical protein B1R32_11518 [Abditibacterium utsteinense]
MDEFQFFTPDFTAQWATWNEEKRCEFLYPQDGSINELRRLMKWVAQSDAQLHEAAAIFLDPQNDLLWLLQGHCRGIHDASKSAFFPAIPMATRHSLRWQYFLAARFLPLPALAWAELPPCVQKFDAQIREGIKVRVAIPTAHEQREAALNLRDWVKKHDAPATLLALL